MKINGVLIRNNAELASAIYEILNFNTSLIKQKYYVMLKLKAQFYTPKTKKKDTYIPLKAFGDILYLKQIWHSKYCFHIVLFLIYGVTQLTLKYASSFVRSFCLLIL